jgi:hypothetical protein
MFQQQEVVAETVGDTFLLLQENRPVLKNQEQSPNSRLPLRIFLLKTRVHTPERDPDITGRH